MTLIELLVYLIVTSSVGALIGAIAGFLINGLAGAKGGAILGGFTGPIVAGIVITIWTNLHRDRTNKSKTSGKQDAHPPPSKPFKVIVGIALLIFILIAIGVWTVFLTRK